MVTLKCIKRSRGWGPFVLLASAPLLGHCSPERVACSSGELVACRCEDNSLGTQQCRGGTWTACHCSMDGGTRPTDSDLDALDASPGDGEAERPQATRRQRPPQTKTPTHPTARNRAATTTIPATDSRPVETDPCASPALLLRWTSTRTATNARTAGEMTATIENLLPTPGAEEVCFDGVDNDCNGTIDDPSSCTGTKNDTCATALQIDFPAGWSVERVMMLDLKTFTDDYQAGVTMDNCTPDEGSGGNAVYRVTLPTEGQLRIDVTGQAEGIDPLAYVRQSCTNAETTQACSDDAHYSNAPSIWIMPEPGTYDIIIDCFNPQLLEPPLNLTSWPVRVDLSFVPGFVPREL